MAEESIKLEGAKLTTFSPKAASGDDPARLSIAFTVEVDTVVAYMTRLTRLYRKRRSITLGFSGLHLQGTELFTFGPKAAKVTKDGDEKEGPKMALSFIVELSAVDEKLGRISELYRDATSATLSLEAVEQLELPKAQPQQLLSNGNGNGKPHDVKDTTPIDIGGKKKGKGKKKQHVPILREGGMQMATATISGGGSIPSRSKAFTSDGSSEGHAKLFTEIHEFVNEWQTEAIDADAAARTAANATTAIAGETAEVIEPGS